MVVGGPARVRTSPDADHFEVERELAARLRTAPADARRELYTACYEELFERVPEHPQLRAATSGQRRREALRQWGFLRRSVRAGATLVEVGAGDCALSEVAATRAARVIAVDVSPSIMDRERLPGNVSRRLSDGTTIPVATASADVVYSDQLMEHLHPDDARAQVADIARSLKRGGRYVCVTPDRATGPHDVSRYHADVACGLHLHEYTSEELEALMRQAGFSRVRFYVGTRGLFARVPRVVLSAAERAVARMPRRTRLWFRDSPLALPLLQIRSVATK